MRALATAAGRDERAAGVRRLPARQGHRDPPRHAAVGARAARSAPERRGAARHPNASGACSPEAADLSAILTPDETTPLCSIGRCLPCSCSPSRPARTSYSDDRRADREARLRHRGVRDHRRAGAQAAARRRRAELPGRRTATTSSARRSRPYDHRAAVPAHVADRRARHARVPAVGRLRQRLPRPAEGPVLRARRQDRQGRLERRTSSAAPPPRRRSARARLPVLHGLRALPAGRSRRRTAS